MHRNSRPTNFVIKGYDKFRFAPLKDCSDDDDEKKKQQVQSKSSLAGTPPTLGGTPSTAFPTPCTPPVGYCDPTLKWSDLCSSNGGTPPQIPGSASAGCFTPPEAAAIVSAFCGSPQKSAAIPTAAPSNGRESLARVFSMPAKPLRPSCGDRLTVNQQDSPELAEPSPSPTLTCSKDDAPSLPEDEQTPVKPVDISCCGQPEQAPRVTHPTVSTMLPVGEESTAHDKPTSTPCCASSSSSSSKEGKQEERVFDELSRMHIKYCCSADISPRSTCPLKLGDPTVGVYVMYVCMFPSAYYVMAKEHLQAVFNCVCGDGEVCVDTVFPIVNRSDGMVNPHSFNIVLRTIGDIEHVQRSINKSVLFDLHGIWFADSNRGRKRISEFGDRTRRLPTEMRHERTKNMPCMPLVLEFIQNPTVVNQCMVRYNEYVCGEMETLPQPPTTYRKQHQPHQPHPAQPCSGMHQHEAPTVPCPPCASRPWKPSSSSQPPRPVASPSTVASTNFVQQW